jgi:hypothetical protein
MVHSLIRSHDTAIRIVRDALFNGLEILCCDDSMLRHVDELCSETETHVTRRDCKLLLESRDLSL